MFKKIILILPFLLLFSLPSFAALDPAVSAELTAVTSNVAELGALLVGLAAVVLGINWLKAMFF